VVVGNSPLAAILKLGVENGGVESTGRVHPTLALGQTLHLHANEVFQLISKIDDTAAEQDALAVVIASDNIFGSLNNSVICGSLTMTGNQFRGAPGLAGVRQIAAIVLGHSARLVGNQAEDPDAAILYAMDGEVATAANLLATVDARSGE
jgi:hypothetical protein